MVADNKIIELIKDKNEQGLSLLHEKYAATIYGIITRIVKDEKVAEEVLQESMLKVWNKLELYDSNKSLLYTWLARVSRNTAIDFIRLKKYQTGNKSQVQDKHVFENSALAIDAKLDSKTMIDSLDDKYHIVLDMAYLQGYSQSEIAQELNLPLGTVKTRIRKGISILRNTLSKEKSLFIGMLVLSLLILCLWN